MKFFDKLKRNTKKEDTDLKIICPICNESTICDYLELYPRDDEIENFIKNDSDLKPPLEWRPELYQQWSQVLTPEQMTQDKIVSPNLCFIHEHSKTCTASGRKSVLLNYYFLNHEQKTAGMSFRLVMTFES